MEEINEQTRAVKKNSGLGLASFILSLVGILVAGIPCGVAAVISGIMSLVKFNKDTQKNKWMGIVGIIIGAIDIILVAIALPTMYKNLGIL